MIVIYETTADYELISLSGWTAYRRHKSGVTKIFDEVWDELFNNEHVLKFDNIEEHLKKFKNEKAKSKAYCDISSPHKGVIEINQYGVLPIIWIVKN